MLKHALSFCKTFHKFCPIQKIKRRREKKKKRCTIHISIEMSPIHWDIDWNWTQKETYELYMKTPRKKSKELKKKNPSHILLHFFHKSDRESLLFKGAHNLKYRCHYFYTYIFAFYKYMSFHIVNNTLRCCCANGERYKCQWAINYLQTSLLLHPIYLSLQHIFW